MTGVQTCALPIYRDTRPAAQRTSELSKPSDGMRCGGTYIIIKGIFWKDQSINDLTVQKENLSQPKIQFKKERL